jgi:PEGA domain
MKQETIAHVATPSIPPDLEPMEESNWLASFESEREPVIVPAKAPVPAKPRRRSLRVPFAVVGLCAGIAGSWLAWQTWTARPASSAPLNVVAVTGTANFNSVPEGASISIDGTVRGVTPLRVSLDAGAHSVQITSGSVTRTIPITIEAGGVVSQYVELAAAPATTGGRLEIGSDPSGAQVALDGVSRGVTPLVIADVAPGQHRVAVIAGDRSVNRTVTVTSGATTALVVSTAPSATGASGGWLTVQAPVEMDILEDGRVLGNTRMERLMLPVGSHRLEFSSPSLEFTAARTVEIAAGRTASVAIVLPQGRISVNAVPWADVFLNGAALGTTPLGEVAVPIGTHELVFRHPQFGERRQVVTVKAQTPARIGIDLRK